MEAKKTEVTSGEVITDKVELVWRIQNFSMMWKSKEFRDRQILHFKAGSSIGLASDWITYFEEKEDTFKAPEGIVTTNKVGLLWVGLERFPPGLKDLIAFVSVKIEAERDTDNMTIRLDAINFLESNGPRRPASAMEWCIYGNAWTLPLINGCLLMELELTVMKPKDCTPFPQQSVQQIEARFKPRFTDKLQEDLAKLLEGSNVQTDATLISKDGVKFPAHRCLLSERSSMFETMFKKPQTGIVRIPDLSSKTVGVLLQFFYTGTLHKDWSEEQVLPELVHAAKKYGLQDLIKFLDQAVGHVCTKENAGRLYNLLRKAGMRMGERQVHNFIKWHTLSFEEKASFEEEGTQQPENDKSEKWKVLRIFRNSWRMILGSSSRKSSSQKSKSKFFSRANVPIPT